MTTTTESPGRFPVAVNGRPYVADLGQYQRRSLDLFRQQADGGREFDEGSLNPEDLWRRSQVDWRFGTGAEFLDRGSVDDAARQQFGYSRGIDPWVPGGKLRLQKSTERILETSGSDEYKLVVVGAYLLIVRVDGVATYAAYYADGSLSTISGLPGTGVVDVATDGRYAYFACGANGIYRWDSTTPATAPTQINLGAVSKVAFVRGRLMASLDTQIYNITDPTNTNPPTALTELAFGSNWTCFGATSAYILAGAHASSGDGGRSTIYRIAVREDGTALGAPVACAELPDGEEVKCIVGYVGIVLLGTSAGFRVATMNGGELSYGPLVEIAGGVQGIEAQGNYAYFTWHQHDEGGDVWADAVSGLGRADLSRFTEPLVPAYASDVMSTVAGSAPSSANVVWHEDSPVFHFKPSDGGLTPAHQGILRRDDTVYVSSGDIYSPVITYGITEGKVPERLEVEMEPLPAGATVVASVLDASDDTVLLTGTASTTGATQLVVDLSSVPATLPNGLRVKLTLTRSTDTLSSPVVTRWTLFANPVPRRGERFIVPLVLRDEVEDAAGGIVHMDPWAEFLALKEIERTGAPIDYQEFGETYRAFVDAIQFGPELEYGPNGKPQGLCLVSMRVFE